MSKDDIERNRTTKFRTMQKKKKKKKKKEKKKKNEKEDAGIEVMNAKGII